MAENQQQDENEQTISGKSESTESLKKILEEINDKYVRLYAEFENYKKFTARNKEEQLKYANESLLKDLLTVVDHLELALQHSYDKKNLNSLSEGVELTLKELKTVLEKYGLVSIDASGKPFDPLIHHAITQVESIEANENTVVNELRKGYKYKDRVIRATLVGVAKKPSLPEDAGSDGPKDQAVATEKNNT
jgi:molecular chaperone GrpE